MFEDELRQKLIELCAQVGAIDVRLVRPLASALPPEDAHRAPLGSGAFLEVWLPGGAEPTGAQSAAIERTARALRACARRWEQKLPELGGSPDRPMRQRVIARIERFLDALAGVQGAANALVTARGRLIASARPLDELHRSRIEFILRRVDAEAARHVGESSHAELHGDDLYAVSFWYGACLIVFFEEPFSLDFVRHRARLVTRELSNLLPDLDDPPRDPARVAPIPES